MMTPRDQYHRALSECRLFADEDCVEDVKLIARCSAVLVVPGLLGKLLQPHFRAILLACYAVGAGSVIIILVLVALSKIRG